jgi:hypothetical protein
MLVTKPIDVKSRCKEIFGSVMTKDVCGKDAFQGEALLRWKWKTSNANLNAASTLVMPHCSSRDQISTIRQTGRAGSAA